MAEETTKGLFVKKIKNLGYPQNQDTLENGIIWYKEDSYKDIDKKISKKFEKASKSLSEKKDGRPDFTIDTNQDLIIVVETKEDIKNHSFCDDLEIYKEGIGNKKDIQNYAINGALHYATFVNDEKDVIAIAVSGIKADNMRITSFILPKKGNISQIELIEDGNYFNTIMTLSDYKKIIDFKLGRNNKNNDAILSELSTYAQVTANYLRANKISAQDRAGFISAVVLALTNEDSTLYKNTKNAIDQKNSDTNKSKVLIDNIGKSAISMLKESLHDIWDNKDKIPKVKRDALDEYYNGILVKALLKTPDGLNKCKKYYKYGDNVLSCCVYSVYENIIVTLKNHTDLDIMGTFYTVFLRYASGDAKDKGIVLTPKHVTELFCDLAEHFLNRKLDENTKVIDICCGTGGFLISSLTKMDANINSLNISLEEKEKRKKQVRERCLIGVEDDPSMFALAYANMRFHGDGKSNLYSCSSLLKDANEKGVVDKRQDGKKVSLEQELLDKNKGINGFTDIDIGMINPPYSTDSQTDKKKGEKQAGASELDFIYSMLKYIKKEGIGIAIVPMSCGSSSKNASLRKIILQDHTLLACMTMPSKLFQDSKVGTQTCVMVFKAHVPHSESNGIVFVSRWTDDGFVTIPHNGRYDKDGNWSKRKAEWMSQLEGTANADDTTFLRRHIADTGKEEFVAEAYVRTPYEKLTDEDFEKQLKKKALFLYMLENDLVGE